MKNYLGLMLLLLLAACGNGDRKAKELPQAPIALLKSANSDSFNLSFGKLLNAYYLLKEDFIAEKDTAGMNHTAIALMNAVDSLQLVELKADSSLVSTAQTYTMGISSELKGMIGEKEIENKRKSFQMVGDQLYDLVRTVQYDQAVIYHDFCPMAFNDQGASWLSNTREIRNPYIPKKMIGCGEVKDSIDFRRK